MNTPIEKTEPEIKKVSLDLLGMDGNAFALIAAFSRQAKKEGWSSDEIAAVRKQATSGDYDNLLRVLMKHSEA